MLPVFVRRRQIFFYQIPDKHLLLRKHFLFKLSTYIQTHEEIISIREDTSPKYQVALISYYSTLRSNKI